MNTASVTALPHTAAIGRHTALRIALAARCLPGVDIAAFARALGEHLGVPLTDNKLATVRIADLKALLQGDEIIDPDFAKADLKQAVRYLWGQDLDPDAPQPDTDLPQDSRLLRVAVASNTAERIDGHFGSCQRFLIYWVSVDSIALAEVRSTAACDEAEDRNAARAELISDCHLVYIQSIGAPAAAKLVRVGVHPVKQPDSGEAREVLSRLHDIVDRPPPWLAKLFGQA